MVLFVITRHIAWLIWGHHTIGDSKGIASCYQQQDWFYKFGLHFYKKLKRALKHASVFALTELIRKIGIDHLYPVCQSIFCKSYVEQQ